MKLLNFTILKLTLCLILGILTAYYIELPFNILFYILIALLVLLCFFWIMLRQKVSRSPVFALIAFLVMVCIGSNAYHIKDEKQQPHHYIALNLNNSTNAICFKIEERLKPDTYNTKYIAHLISVNENPASGKLLVNIAQDSTTQSFPIDAVVFTSAAFQNIQQPLNPHQFNYAKYLELKQVYQQVYLNHSEVLVLSSKPSSIYGYAEQLRTKINKNLTKAGFEKDGLSIINALLLGQRQTIDKNTYNNYVNAGTIHILAVSGLHVGILLLILNFILKPLLYFKYGPVLRPLIIVILLWSFAIIAGLSPSVTRAVTMFSIISIAMHLKRPTNIYNTLAISAFFILLIKPRFLFEVGFQMSYLAVLGIVSFQPIIYHLWNPKYWIVNKAWQIFTVTIAAQIGVVPISLLYFHQFPGLFFISNLIVIPFLGLILGLGLLVIVLTLLNTIPDILVSLYSGIINSLNAFIAWVAQFEGFLFRDIPFTIIQVISAYLVIIAFLQMYKTKTFKWVTVCLVGIIGFQSTFIYNDFKNDDDAFIIFNKSRFSMIGFKYNNHLEIYHNLDSLKQISDNVIKNYKVGKMINDLSFNGLENVYQFNDKTILVIDSFGIYKNLSFKPNYILLRNSPKINLNRMIDSLLPDKIIADASNFKTYVKRWKATCRHKKIPFHYTNEKGAYILH